MTTRTHVLDAPAIERASFDAAAVHPARLRRRHGRRARRARRFRLLTPPLCDDTATAASRRAAAPRPRPPRYLAL